MTEGEYLEKIDEAIIETGKYMDLDDLDPEDPDYETQWEARFHCGVCVTRSVMEQVWPAVEEYIAAIKEGKVDVPSQ
ncbi:MAG: hypothetical protein ACOVLE_12320 [Pirellula staleyi]